MITFQSYTSYERIQRFTPYPNIHTDAVILLDESQIISGKVLENLFDQWNAQHGIIGTDRFSVKCADNKGDHQGCWFPQSSSQFMEAPNTYTFVSGIIIAPATTLWVITCMLPPGLHYLVGEGYSSNPTVPTEMILMNLVTPQIFKTCPRYHDISSLTELSQKVPMIQGLPGWERYINWDSIHWVKSYNTRNFYCDSSL